MKYKKIVFLFPGQGAQYVGMGNDFIDSFSAARLTFEEADELFFAQALMIDALEAFLDRVRHAVELHLDELRVGLFKQHEQRSPSVNL